MIQLVKMNNQKNQKSISRYVKIEDYKVFDYAIPESIQPIFGLGWISMVIGLGYGGYVAWGDKMSSGAE